MLTVKSADGTKDKSVVIVDQGTEQDAATGQLFDSVKCSCRFSIQYGMFCMHMFAAFNALQIKTAEKFQTIGKRWTRAHQEKVIPGLYSENKDLNPEAFARKF